MNFKEFSVLASFAFGTAYCSAYISRPFPAVHTASERTKIQEHRYNLPRYDSYEIVKEMEDSI